jgi:hypothetical protein
VISRGARERLWWALLLMTDLLPGLFLFWVSGMFLVFVGGGYTLMDRWGMAALGFMSGGIVFWFAVLAVRHANSHRKTRWIDEALAASRVEYEKRRREIEQGG